MGLLVPLAAFAPVFPASEQDARQDVDRLLRLDDATSPADAETLPRVVPGPVASAPPAGDVTEIDDRDLAWPGDAEIEEQGTAVTDTLEERILRVFIRALEDEDPSMRSQAAHALGQAERTAGVAPLSAALRNDPVANVRLQAAWALGMIEDPTGVPALSTALADESAAVRSQAAWALGMIESDAAVAGLTTALSDEQERVRSQAAWALGMIESPEAVAPLMGALRGDESPSVRSQAAWALGMIKDDTAAEALVDAIEDPDARVRKQAMWALAQVL